MVSPVFVRVGKGESEIVLPYRTYSATALVLQNKIILSASIMVPAGMLPFVRPFEMLQPERSTLWPLTLVSSINSSEGNPTDGMGSGRISVITTGNPCA